MKINQYFLKIINLKLFFLKPKQNNILVYDRASKWFSDILFKGKKVCYYDTRHESINLYVFFKTILSTFFFNFYQNYKFNFFSYVNPKIIYTSVDTNIGFYKLKKIYPKAIYISDQNGMRSKKFYKDLKKEKKAGTALISDILFCFGNNDKKKISHYIKSKIYQLGNTVNNNFIYKSNKSNIYKVVYIPTGGILKKIDIKIFSYLIKFCEEKKLKLLFLDKQRFKRKKIIQSFFDGKFSYLSHKKKRYSYSSFNKNTIAVFTHSTLGYDLLAKGIKAFSFDSHHDYHERKKSNSGFYWENLTNYNNFKSAINKVINYENKKWKKKCLKLSYELNYYDKNNLKKKRIINNCLKSIY